MKQVEHPDEVLVHVPERCFACGGDLDGAEVLSEEVRQVFDLPAVALHVAEHHAQRRRCRCGATSAAPFPQGLSAPAQYGPGLRALAIYLICFQHLPYQRAARSCRLAGTPVTGTLQAIVERGGEDLEEFEVLIRDRLIGSAVTHFDETGARAEGALRWVHSASTGRLTLYRLHERRGEEGIDHLGVRAL